jgi:hypothetical protein
MGLKRVSDLRSPTLFQPAITAFSSSGTVRLEKQLSQFYWPVYLYLEKDNLIWERLQDRDQDPESAASKLSRQIEGGVILPNHREAMSTIEGNLHLAADSAIVDGSLRYVRHVKLYEMLRLAGSEDDPVSHGEA